MICHTHNCSCDRMFYYIHSEEQRYCVYESSFIEIGHCLSFDTVYLDAASKKCISMATNSQKPSMLTI